MGDFAIGFPGLPEASANIWRLFAKQGRKGVLHYQGPRKDKLPLIGIAPKERDGINEKKDPVFPPCL